MPAMTGSSYAGILARWATAAMMKVMRKLRSLRSFSFLLGWQRLRPPYVMCLPAKNQTLNDRMNRFGVLCRIFFARF
jgi:hypothetical protein